MAELSVTISPILSSDVNAAIALSTAAGWNQVQSDWERLLTLWPSLSLGAKLNGSLIGTTTIARFGALGWVGMVLVAAEHQGRGIGGLVLDAALNAAAAAGITSLGLDATDQGRPLYAKRGFVEYEPIVRWCRAERSATVAGGSAPGDSPVISADLLRLDRGATGLGRERLLRDLLGRTGSVFHATRQGGRLSGFGFVRRGRSADQLGPLIAETFDTAAHILTLAAQACPGRMLMDLPGKHNPLEQLLGSLGFLQQRRLVRMYRGMPPRAAETPAARVFAAAGFELG